MRVLDEILEQVKRLSARERRELVERIQADKLDEQPKAQLTERQRKALQYFATKKRWVPPKGAPSVVELLREDRDR